MKTQREDLFWLMVPEREFITEECMAADVQNRKHTKSRERTGTG